MEPTGPVTKSPGPAAKSVMDGTVASVAAQDEEHLPGISDGGKETTMLDDEALTAALDNAGQKFGYVNTPLVASLSLCLKD